MARALAVAATGTQARDAGLAVLFEGGNAVDAAVAAALVAACTEPGIVSLAGGAYVAIWPAEGEPVVVDGNVAMPGSGAAADRFGAGLREVVTDYGGGVTLYAGLGSVATPGAVPALARAVDEHAVLPWARLVAPAERATREGYPTSHAGARYLSHVADSLFGVDAEARALVSHPDGRPLLGGELATNPELADTLAALADQGGDLFRTGEVGRRLVAQMSAGDGLITHEDLAFYAPLVREPVLRVLGDWTVALNPPPCVGGPVLAVMLGALSGRDRWDHRDLIEVQRAVLGHRLTVHDLSTNLEADGHALLTAVQRHGLAGLPSAPNTAHVSAVDSEGTACAITLSSGYGAGMCIPGTGVLLNNCLGEVELNRRGLHALTPGTRVASNMAPTVARASGGRSLAIGSPGADRITTALFQVLAAGCLREEDLQAAIDRPRLHVRLRPGAAPMVEHEPDPAISEAVDALGLEAHTYPGPHMYFGGVGAALRRSGDDVTAAGDARRVASVGSARLA